MASSKARSRNSSTRSAKASRASQASRAGGTGGNRTTSRTATAQKSRAQQAEETEEPTATAPKAPNGQRQAQGGPSRSKRQPAVAPDPVATEPARPAGPPLWVQLVTFGLAILGLADSAYETYAHFNGSHLFACAGTGGENCTAVITSPQSMVFGVIPVAILGLLFYVFVVAIMSPWAWRIRRREVAQLRLVSMVVGMGFVMYLIYAELYQIGNWCLYCTGVHIITFLLFCITVVSAAIWGLGKSAKAS